MNIVGVSTGVILKNINNNLKNIYFNQDLKYILCLRQKVTLQKGILLVDIKTGGGNP